MKKALTSLCLVGSMVALSACDTTSTGYVDEAPYAIERTASHASEAVIVTPVRAAPAERVFHRAQMK